MTITRRVTCVLLFSALAAVALRAQTPYLVKDINVSRSSNAISSEPAYFFRYGSRVFFTAATFEGSGVWGTDGTEAGTSRLLAIGRATDQPVPPQFTIVNGTLLFNARDIRGEELWSTDGTTAGTRLMADINSGGASSSPGDRIVFNGSMIFSAHDGVNGRELWITDGTPAGTRFFKDLLPGPNGSEPRSFVVLNNVVYFAAAGGLWKSDGTAAGTVVVKPLTDARSLTLAGSRIFFVGYSAETGYEPWISDGTEAGTRLIADIYPGTQNSTLYGLTAFGDRVLFAAHEPKYGLELWISDGTVAGTRVVRDLNPGAASSMNFPSMTVIGGTAFFGASGDTTGVELWKTDGTEAGTTLVRDILPGEGGSAPHGFELMDGRVFFVASVDGITPTLWVTDGTTSGTRQITANGRAASVGSRGGGPLLTSIAGTIYFAGLNSLNGFEPWKSDGTDGGTLMIANLARDQAPSSDPDSLTAVGDRIFFTAWDGTAASTDQRALWVSDGTPEGTLNLADSPDLSLMAVGRWLFFTRKGELWTSDGTPEGTRFASDFVNRFPSTPSIRLVVGDNIFAVVANSELWVTTVGGKSAMRLKAPAGFRFVEVAGRAMFIGDGALWSTDGTAEGTYIVVTSGNQTFFGESVVMGGHLYYGDGRSLWKSDGTFDGTVVVKAVPGSVANLIAAGRNLFFTSSGELWVTDGTEAGTRALPATPSGWIAAAGDRLVFVAHDTAIGFEPWGSDGTVEGTRLLRDIYPGPVTSGIFQMTSVDGVAYFGASDDLVGNEVWVTDGTSEGTKNLADVEPGITGSFPRAYVRAGERLFFSATTSQTGKELWALPLPSTPRLTISDVRVDEETATARFSITLSSPSARDVTVEYATSDATALAASDYDATSGTLTIAAGQTSQSIEVRIRGDVSPENNETFYVTLRNPVGATLTKSSAYAVINDDDQFADLAATHDFSSFESLSVFMMVANNGPRTATNFGIRHTATPGGLPSSCTSCTRLGHSLAPGASGRAFEYGWSSIQQYITATVTAQQRDPLPSNDTIAWTMNFGMAMDALYLTPGSQANVWFSSFGGNASGVSITSSDPAVVSVPSSLSTIPGKSASFIARGLTVGTSTIRVSTASGSSRTLKIDVVAPGTKLRWPGAFKAEGSFQPINNPVTFTIVKTGTVPYTGETATGPVTIKANGVEVARATLESAVNGRLEIPVYFAVLGTLQVTIEYGGDSNFLPISQEVTANVARGHAAVTASVERSATTATVRVRVAGSPAAVPTGTIIVSEPGVIPQTSAPLIASASGEAHAEIALTNVSYGVHTLEINYSGDTRYFPGSQNVRMTDGRKRGVRK